MRHLVSKRVAGSGARRHFVGYKGGGGKTFQANWKSERTYFFPQIHARMFEEPE